MRRGRVVTRGLRERDAVASTKPVDDELTRRVSRVIDSVRTRQTCEADSKECHMQSRLVVATLLAACLVSSIALAAKDKANVTFESFAASGVSGDATLSAMPSNQVLIHASLRGLEPNTQYSALIFDASQTCD